MVDITVIRPKDDGPPRLLPASAYDVEQLERVRTGKPALASVVFKRSLPHLRWYRCLVGIVAEAKGMHPNALHAHLKFKAGLVRQILLAEGKAFIELQSTAFSSMDETAFTEFRIIAVNLLFRDFLDPSDKRAVWKRVEEMVGPCPW